MITIAVGTLNFHVTGRERAVTVAPEFPCESQLEDSGGLLKVILTPSLASLVSS